MLRHDEPADVPGGLTDETGTKADVTALVDGSRAAGVDVDIDWIGDDLVGADDGLRRAVHRVVREALTNVHKHAPGATVSVRVARTSDLVTVEVTNGMPSLPVAAHCAGEESAGLAGLQERVRLLGGMLRAEPTSDGGFSVVARVPVDAQAKPLVAGEQPAPLAQPVQALPARLPRTTGFPRDAVISVAVVVGLFVLAGLASTIMGLTYEAGVAGQDPAVLEIGMPLSDFLAQQGANDPLAQLAAHGQEPAMPAGATCLYQPDNVIMTEDAMVLVASPDDEVVVNRYCFVDDKLVEIRDFALTSAAK